MVHMCSAHCIMVLYIYLKFHENISNGLKQSRHEYMFEMAIFYVQRATAPKVRNPGLWFMCCALLYIYVKSQENISNGFQFTEQT